MMQRTRTNELIANKSGSGPAGGYRATIYQNGSLNNTNQAALLSSQMRQQPREQYALEEANSSALSYMPRPISSAAAYHSYHHQLAHMHQSHQQVTTTQNLRKAGTST